MRSILIHDPQEPSRETFKKILSARFPLIVTENRQQCLAALQQAAPIAMAFISPEDDDGLPDPAFFSEIRTIVPKMTIVAIGTSGGRQEETAAEAVSFGANGYILKPLKEEDVLILAEKDCLE